MMMILSINVRMKMAGNKIIAQTPDSEMENFIIFHLKFDSEKIQNHKKQINSILPPNCRIATQLIYSSHPFKVNVGHTTTQKI